MTDADLDTDRPVLVAPAEARRAPRGEAARCLAYWRHLARRGASEADRLAALDGTLTPDPLTLEKQ